MLCNTCGGPTDDNLSEHFNPSDCIEHLSKINNANLESINLLIKASHSGTIATQTLLDIIKLHNDTFQHYRTSLASLNEVVTELQNQITMLQGGFQQVLKLLLIRPVPNDKSTEGI